MGFVDFAPPRWSVVDLTQGVKMGDENKRMKEYGVEEDDTLCEFQGSSVTSGVDADQLWFCQVFKFQGYPGRDSRFRIGWHWPFLSLQKKNKSP
jgi:hypothetical protein